MTGTPGRPLSTELSEQLLAVAVDILADEGWGRLNSDRVAARARAGKAGIYRRWPTMSALARAAVGRFHLVVLPAEGGSVREDLLGLLTPRWTQPLSREERAVASLVGAARHDAELRAGLDEALVRPLAAAVEEVCARAERRGEPVRVERVRLLSSVLEAFWWQRYRMPEPLTVDQVVLVVDEVLMPLVRPLAETVAA
ncbi:TetR-like C-terminal domain-containing protein [Blastococcus xanthinilyticus]|uniref:TetR family transcriptional regulator n=1 Tax=Blastococcus xanthinilyticus TaxID=1564164 RepID=A0A5S5CU04_9ACTN|nr:TetR-like C-terminal domain-containing protein [Blastococcus xanthinilyticus]TYP87240.1 TetR family transcriptional regulator [Blastococcus xanthinilyticus]